MKLLMFIAGILCVSTEDIPTCLVLFAIVVICFIKSLKEIEE